MIKPVILAIPKVSCHFIGMGTIFLYRKINRKIIQVSGKINCKKLMINLIGILNRLLMYEKYVNDTIIVTVIISIIIKYMKERKQFGRPLSAFQGLQWMIAEMETKIEAAKLLVYKAAWLKKKMFFASMLFYKDG